MAAQQCTSAYTRAALALEAYAFSPSKWRIAYFSKISELVPTSVLKQVTPLLAAVSKVTALQITHLMA